MEETVSGNTKLERELLVLRQKLQASRDKSAHLNYMSSIGDSRTDAFESELRKVRDSVGDIRRQREELSKAVNQLTLDSNPTLERLRASNNESTSKRLDLNWTETDLDTLQKKNTRNANVSSAFEEPEPYYYQYQQSSEDDHWQNNGMQRTTFYSFFFFIIIVVDFIINFQINKKLKQFAL